jgi:hypothetical protein
MKTEPARGYYIGKDDIIYIWGKGNIGNCYYVPDNDEPRWAGVMYDIACQWVDERSSGSWPSRRCSTRCGSCSKSEH